MPRQLKTLCREFIFHWHKFPFSSKTKKFGFSLDVEYASFSAPVKVGKISNSDLKRFGGSRPISGIFVGGWLGDSYLMSFFRFPVIGIFSDIALWLRISRVSIPKKNPADWQGELGDS